MSAFEMFSELNTTTMHLRYRVNDDSTWYLYRILSKHRNVCKLRILETVQTQDLSTQKICNMYVQIITKQVI